MKITSHQLALFGVFTMLAAPAQAVDVVVPNANATTSGGSNNGFPFNTGSTQIRYQQLFDSSQFGTGPVTLYALKFRQASDASGGSPFSSTLPSVTINLATAATQAGAASSTFASNVGADNLTVFSGALSLSSSAAPRRDGGVQPFDIVIEFATPFTYNPLSGDLLLDVFNFGGGTTTAFDFITGGQPALSSLFSFGNANASTGFVRNNSGLVAAFQVTPLAAVPEPSSWAMLIVGFGAVGYASRRRTRVRFAQTA